MEYDVFISCKSEDYKYAEEIYNFLKGNGFNTFLANKELRQMGDSEYRRSISQALKSTYHLIVFASNADYIDSEWVYYEWDWFLVAKIKGKKQIAFSYYTGSCGLVHLFACVFPDRQRASLLFSLSPGFCENGRRWCLTGLRTVGH